MAYTHELNQDTARNYGYKVADVNAISISAISEVGNERMVAAYVIVTRQGY